MQFLTQNWVKNSESNMFESRLSKKKRFIIVGPTNMKRPIRDHSYLHIPPGPDFEFNDSHIVALLTIKPVKKSP